MNWKKITDTMTPYLSKAKEYWLKAAEFAENQIQTTPLFIKTQADYDALIAEKRVIIIAYDDTNEVAKDVQLYSTIWMTRAFFDVAKCRFLSINEFPDLANDAWLSGPIDMQVRFEWVETQRMTTIESIKKWWNSPIYIKNSEQAASVTTDSPKKNEIKVDSVTVDPLEAVSSKKNTVKSDSVKKKHK